MTTNLSILPPQMVGVMFVTGKRGLGKSLLSSTADFPQNICFLDFENKGKGFDSDLHFGLYRALTQEAVGSQGKGLFNIAWDCFRSMPKDKFSVVILDNISPLEMAMGAEAVQNAKRYAQEYGLNADKIKKNSWGHKNAVVNCMIADACAMLHAAGVKLIIATSHVKPKWLSSQPVPGKFRFKGADRWQELSILTLILTPGDYPPIPSAIVQKEQLGLVSINQNPTPEELEAMIRGEMGHGAIRRLPVRLPEATFQKIRWYLHNPANLNEPAEGESLNIEEAEEFGDTLSKEQLQFVTAAIDLERVKMQEEIGAQTVRVSSGKAFTPPGAKQVDPIVKKAKGLAATMPVEKVAEEMKMALPVVRGMLEG